MVPAWQAGRTERLSKALQSSKQSAEAADRDARAMVEAGALTTALNWYRAMPLSDLRSTGAKVSVPTMYVWSDGDTALLGKAAHDCGRYVTGKYRFETLHGVSHWIPDEQPDAIADLLLEGFRPIPFRAPIARAAGLEPISRYRSHGQNSLGQAAQSQVTRALCARRNREPPT